MSKLDEASMYYLLPRVFLNETNMYLKILLNLMTEVRQKTTQEQEAHQATLQALVDVQKVHQAKTEELEAEQKAHEGTKKALQIERNTNAVARSALENGQNASGDQQAKFSFYPRTDNDELIQEVVELFWEERRLLEQIKILEQDSNIGVEDYVVKEPTEGQDQNTKLKERKAMSTEVGKLQRELQAERKLHEDTREKVRINKKANKILRIKLETEQEAHQATKAALEAEQEAHKATKASFVIK